MQAVWWLALAILAGYGLVVGLAFAFQERLVYFPERELVADPGAIGLAFEEVDIETSDGERLHGWYVPAGGGEGTAPGGEGTAPGGEGTASGGEGTAPGGERPTVLFLHGNAGNISHRLETVQMLHGLDVDLLLIDYRGYGRSSGRPGEAGTYRDADAAWRHLVETRAVSTDRLVVFGRSLGAAIAVELATCRPCAALVIESAFTSVPDLGAMTYPWLPVRWLARVRYDTLDRVAHIDCPKLVAHSRDDELVPFRMGRALFDAAAPPKRFVAMRGGHNDGFITTGEPYRRAMIEFLAGL